MPRKGLLIVHGEIGTGPVNLAPYYQYGAFQGNALQALPRYHRCGNAWTWTDGTWTGRATVDDSGGLEVPVRVTYGPHSYQQKALDAERTGKTAVTLWIAKKMVGLGGRVLSLVLMAQTMREWFAQQLSDLRFPGICSDTQAGSGEEDASLRELGHARDLGPASALGRAFRKALRCRPGSLGPPPASTASVCFLSG